MKNSLPIIIKKFAASVLTLGIVLAFLSVLARQPSAHEGMEHITGTVATVSENVLSVKTIKGATVEVRLDAKTQYVQGKEHAKLADIKPGTRVVVHAMKTNGAFVAHEVSIGVNKPATSSATKTQK